MHYFSPSRSRLGGPNSLPLLEGASARSVIPGLHIAPREQPDGTILAEVSVFLPFEGGGAARREILMPIEDFPGFWASWLEDPEGVARNVFKWTPQKARVTALDLDDLLGDL